MTLPVHHVTELGTTVVLRSTGSKHATAGHCQTNRSGTTSYSCCSQTCSSCIEPYQIRRAFDVYVTGQPDVCSVVVSTRAGLGAFGRWTGSYTHATYEHGHVTTLNNHVLVWYLKRHSMCCHRISTHVIHNVVHNEEECIHASRVSFQKEIWTLSRLSLVMLACHWQYTQCVSFLVTAHFCAKINTYRRFP